jgi:hypothetical protein
MTARERAFFRHSHARRLLTTADQILCKHSYLIYYMKLVLKLVYLIYPPKYVIGRAGTLAIADPA